MGALGFTTFCKNGHIVQTVPHHYIVSYKKRICPICNSLETASITEWPSVEYGATFPPAKAKTYDEVLQPVKYGNNKIKIPVYDVSEIKIWNLAPTIEETNQKKFDDSIRVLECDYMYSDLV